MNVTVDAAQSPRRSKRLQNKRKHNSLPLIGDKHFMFTHDFRDTHHRRDSQNASSVCNPLSCPTISRSKRRLQLVHHQPNVFVIENFLTDNEVDHLLNIASCNHQKFSTSYTQSTASDQIFTKQRTSTFIFLQRGLDKVVRAIERRAADLVSIPVDNVEELQIVRYTDGQQFSLHHDAGTLINETIRGKPPQHSCSHSTDSSSCSDSSSNNNSAAVGHGNPSFSAPPQLLQLLPVLFPSQSSQLQNPMMRLHQLPQQVNQGAAACHASQSTPNKKPVRSQSCPPSNDNGLVGASICDLRAFDIADEDIDLEMTDDATATGVHLSKEERSEMFDEFSIEVVKPVRLFSYFVYLNTLSDEGGGQTYFPKLGLKVRPERGKAVLWCNVEPHNVMMGDPMVIHRGMPVLNHNMKIGLNIWINHEPIKTSYY